MFESKYSKVLTAILIIVIVAILGLLGFLGYDYYQNYVVTKDTSDFVDNFQGEVSDGTSTEDTQNPSEDENAGANPFDQIKDANTSSGSSQKQMYKGFGVLGTMEIPTTNFKYPILEKVTKKSIETAVAFLYGTGINEAGNSVIIGHNYRNGLFFSNNKKLNIGDKIYITDNNGKKLIYTIYNKFETTPEDTSFYQRDTGGKPEVTLSTCTDDSSARLIICAKAE
ncbi:MAG: sortase [Clostridia bacterium]|nr:sortase [Clostridia bacterium]